jgi:ribonuclease-3
MPSKAKGPRPVAPFDDDALRAFAGRWGFAPDSEGLRRALTHRSVAKTVEESSERLEFLGDAVLGFVVARHVFDALPGEPESVLTRSRTRVVRGETLADAARQIGVEKLLRIGGSEEKIGSRTRDSLLADAFEALIGALYLERGEDAARAFIRETLAGPLAEVAGSPPPPDPKTQLQIVLQADGRGLPNYRIVEESGKGHAMRFVAEALAGDDGEVLGRGGGTSKRAAQTEAAAHALRRREEGTTQS